MNRYKTNTNIELTLTDEEAKAYGKIEKLTFVGKAENTKEEKPSRVREVQSELETTTK